MPQKGDHSKKVTSTVTKAQAGYEKAIIFARSEMWQEITTGKAGSGSIAVMDGGKIVYAEGFGMADREKSIPVDPDTLFNIGSVSKVFTAVAIMLLVDQGKVDLDKPAVKYLPEFTMADPRYQVITVRMLLSHTSGIPGSTLANNYGYSYNHNVFRETLENLSRSHLNFTPGAMHIYCNDGFTLLEMIVERVSSQKYIDFLASNIFQPLSLTSTGPGVGQRPEEIAAGYYKAETGKKEPLQIVSMLGSGGLSSTPSDLCRFADAFSGSGPQILSKGSLDEISKVQPSLMAGKLLNPEASFGLGWGFTCLPQYQSQGIKVLGKDGGTFEYTTLLMTAPEQRISVAVIETGNSQGGARICREVFRAVLAQKGLIKNVGSEVSFPLEHQNIPNKLKMFDGYYIGIGGDPFKMAFDFQKNVVSMYNLTTGTENKNNSLFYNNGYFYDDQGNRSYFATVDGANYHILSVFGMDRINLQKLDPVQNPQKLKIDMNGKQWLRRNVKPFEEKTLLVTHVITSRTIEDLPGYVDLGGLKMVQSPEYAGMPGVLRDQRDLTLLDRNGQIWAQVSEFLRSPSECASDLKSGANPVTISSSGYNEWLTAGQDAILSFSIPEGGRVIIFSPTGPIIYDSSTDSGSVFAGKGGWVELVGQPGDNFSVTAQFRR